MIHVSAAHFQFDLPTAWPDVSTRAALAILLPGELTTPGLLSLLSGVEETLLQQAPHDLAEAVAPYLQFLSDDPAFEVLPVPKRLTLPGYPAADIPANLNAMTYGQKIAIADELSEMEEQGTAVNFLSAAPVLLPVLLYPHITGKPFADIADTKVLWTQIEGLPATQTLPLAAFFLSSFSRLPPSGRISFRVVKPPTRWRRWHEAWSRGWRALIRTMSSRPSPKP